MRQVLSSLLSLLSQMRNTQKDQPDNLLIFAEKYINRYTNWLILKSTHAKVAIYFCSHFLLTWVCSIMDYVAEANYWEPVI